MSSYGVPFSRGPEVTLKEHADACDLRGLKSFARKSKRPVAIDLFCGAGGLSYGLDMAGFQVIAAVDIDPAAAATHRAHFPGASLCADLGDPATVDALCGALRGVKLDLVAGGPPCQPYSQAAFSKVRHLRKTTDKADDARRSLWGSFVEVVRRTNPRAVMVENVPDMGFGRDGAVLRSLVAELESLGYTVHTRVLASNAFGVPQHRQRLFTIGVQRGIEFRWPAPQWDSERVLWDAISDLPAVVGGDKVERRRYSGIKVRTQRYYRAGVSHADKNIIFDHYTRAVRADDLEAFKLMDPNTRYADLPTHLKRYRDDIFVDKYKRLGWHELSRTITAHISQDGYWYIHPDQHRTLTVREAARIQTFPDHFRFCGFPRHAFRQIGEAVPPLLGKALAEAVIAALSSSPSKVCHPSTYATASILIDWYAEQKVASLTRPWVRGRNVWQILLGHVLYPRGPSDKINASWSELRRRWPSAKAFLSDAQAAVRLKTGWCGETTRLLKAIARLLVQTPRPDFEELTIAGVPASMAQVALAHAGLAARRPVTAALGRMAMRYWGREMQAEDGRGSAEMLVGRLIGEDVDGQGYRAVTEVAGRFCGPQKPLCGLCPLGAQCAGRYENALAPVTK